MAFTPRGGRGGGDRGGRGGFGGGRGGDRGGRGGFSRGGGRGQFLRLAEAQFRDKRLLRSLNFASFCYSLRCKFLRAT
jgi:hypothetical protein